MRGWVIATNYNSLCRCVGAARLASPDVRNGMNTCARKCRVKNSAPVACIGYARTCKKRESIRRAQIDGCATCASVEWGVTNDCIRTRMRDKGSKCSIIARIAPCHRIITNRVQIFYCALKIATIGNSSHIVAACIGWSPIRNNIACAAWSVEDTKRILATRVRVCLN